MLGPLLGALLGASALSPPPLVQAPEEDNQAVPPEAESAPEREPEPDETVQDPAQDSKASLSLRFGFLKEGDDTTARRLSFTLLGAVVLTVPALVVLAVATNCQSEACNSSLVMNGALLASASIVLGSFAGHRLAGGEGSFGRAILGTLFGVAIGATLAIAVANVATGGVSSNTFPFAALVGAAVVAGVGPGVLLERSHHTNVAERLGFGVTPTRGGARAVLTWAF